LAAWQPPFDQNYLVKQEIAHLHCNTPALAGGARERSAAQVSSGRAHLPWQAVLGKTLLAMTFVR